ncbi:DUF3263 domain-containing protein [Pimelobacter simplex]|uniref:DUF3263 domain-containing protein n=1 Tax=Nocardioides simplex TaxID=2045 RepID=UPI003AAC9F16
MLSVRDHMTLRLASAHYRYPARREADVHELLAMSPTLFWRHVHTLLDSPAALAAYPREVNRLRRLREQRRGARRAT